MNRRINFPASDILIKALITSAEGAVNEIGVRVRFKGRIQQFDTDPDYPRPRA